MASAAEDFTLADLKAYHDKCVAAMIAESNRYDSSGNEVAAAPATSAPATPSHVCLNEEGKPTCDSPICREFTYGQLKAYLQDLSAFDFKVAYAKLFLYRFKNTLTFKRETLLKCIRVLECSNTPYNEATVLDCVVELQELRSDVDKVDTNLGMINKYLKAEFCEANSFQVGEPFMLTRYVRELISAYGTPHSLSAVRKYF